MNLQLTEEKKKKVDLLRKFLSFKLVLLFL